LLLPDGVKQKSFVGRGNGYFPAMPQDESANPKSSSLLRRAFVVCVICLAIFQFSENTTDIDLWGHVLFGQEFLHTGHLARTDPYSWTANGQPWINHEIIAEVALALAHCALGGTGLLLLKIAVGLLTFGITLSIACKQMSPGARLIAWAFGALAVVEISYGFAPRPQIFTALALAAELWILAAIHRGHRRWAFALPPLFALWINTHGGVLAGIILLFVATIATIAQSFCSRVAPSVLRSHIAAPVPGNIIKPLVFSSVVSAAALLINPYGFSLIRWLVESVRWLRPQIGEWNPVQFNGDHAAFFLCVAIAATSFLLSRRPIALWELAVTGALCFMAFRSARHTPLFCIAALAFIPPHLADVLERFENSFARLRNLFRKAGVQKVFAALLAAISLGIIFAAGTLHKQRAWTMEVPRKEYPVAALEFIKQHGLHGNLLVFFDWGEECIWELPDSRVSIDGRLDTCYPREVFDAQWNFYNAEMSKQPVLNLEQTDFALLPPNMAGAVMLWKKYAWQPVYRDDTAVVLVRDLKQFPLLAGLQATAQGSAEGVKGRAAFPDAPSARISGP
jgi:hypothetical protein